MYMYMYMYMKVDDVLLIELWCALDRVVVILVGGADGDKHVNDTQKRMIQVAIYSVKGYDIFQNMGKYIRGSYKLYIYIVSGACDHQHDHCRHDSLVYSHPVPAPGMVVPSTGEEGGHPELSCEL